MNGGVQASPKDTYRPRVFNGHASREKPMPTILQGGGTSSY